MTARTCQQVYVEEDVRDPQTESRFLAHTFVPAVPGRISSGASPDPADPSTRSLANTHSTTASRGTLHPAFDGDLTWESLTRAGQLVATDGKRNGQRQPAT